MQVTLLDTQTDQTFITADNQDGFWWAEGNGACDCNRRVLMGVPATKEENTCEGCKRFLIIAANTNEYSLRELNEDYPVDLLKAHGIL